MKLLAALLLFVPLMACDSEGPLERAGEEVDEFGENVSEGEETTGNRLDDAVDDARDGLDDAAEELE